MELFLYSLGIGYSGAMMPGPLLTYSIERSLKRGWKVGLLVPLGHVLLEILIVMLLYFGLGRLLDNSAAKSAVFFAGGAVLLLFAFGMLKGAIRGGLSAGTAEGIAKPGGNLAIVVKSGLISVLNPYFILWWATIGLGLLVSGSRSGLWGVGLVYAGHAMADFTWYFAVALLCSRISRFIGGKVYRVIIAALGLFLAGFAVWFLVNGIILL